MSDDLAPVVEAFLNDFYGDVDWRKALDGERLVLDTSITGTEGKTEGLTFVADGVRQVGPLGPFDAVACAEVLTTRRDSR